MISVLIVDDSAFMRKALSMMLEGDDEVRVIDTARDGQEAVEKARRLRPDVITMDVEMPRMDGITALRHIMKERPVPVIMISSLTKEGARATVEAMEAGAVDFIPKQRSFVSLEITKIKEELKAKIKTVARSRYRLFRRDLSAVASAALPPRRAAAPRRVRAAHARLVAIGVSTGGPFALQKVIPALPADLRVPVVVVQHMPAHFTRSLAERIDAMSPLHVCEAEHGMRVEPGKVLVAPGGRHLTFRKSALGTSVATPDEPAAALHKPSVDVTFRSAESVYGGAVLSVIMTGMGRDGLEGVRLLRSRGARVIAQDEDSCVVYGMPRAVAEAGLADAVLPLEDLAAAITAAVGRAAPAAV